MIRAFGDGRPLQPRRRAAPIELIEGFTSLPVGAIRLLLDRTFVGRLKLPMLANAIAFLVVLAGLFFGSRALLLGWFGDGTASSWLSGLGSLLAAMLVTFLLGPVIVETAISPFLDGLAESTESAHSGRPMPAVAPGIWEGIVSGARASARILAVQLILLVPLLLLALTGVGVLVAVVISAWLCALVWFDLPCQRRGYTLAERRSLLRANWAHAVGFGLAFQLGMLVPIFNLFLLMPAAAVAVSALYFRCEKVRPLDSRANSGTVGPA